MKKLEMEVERLSKDEAKFEQKSGRKNLGCTTSRQTNPGRCPESEQ